MIRSCRRASFRSLWMAASATTLVIGGAGVDVLFGGDDNDELSGAAGADDLFGGEATMSSTVAR